MAVAVAAEAGVNAVNLRHPLGLLPAGHGLRSLERAKRGVPSGVPRPREGHPASVRGHSGRGAGDGEQPCGACRICRAIDEARFLDLFEIDAASNNGVDDIRDLRERVGFAPSEGRYKVYIIDEAHMLSNAAFNALLKTLEEPPGHVIFVLATTEPERIPDTITSRCQRFEFRRITRAEGA